MYERLHFNTLPHEHKKDDTGVKVSTVFKFLLLSLLFLSADQLSFGAVADSTQVATDSVPVKAKKPSTKNDTWFLPGEPDNHFVIDSTIFHIEDYNLVQRQGIEYMNTGNTGSAAYPTVFSIDKHMGFNPGYNQYDIYKYEKDSIKHYQLIRPYVELGAMFGLNKENVISARFANQYKKMIYYGVDFTRMFSPGTYGAQQTNVNGFNLYASYISKNKHWNIEADMVFNSVKNQENGGVIADPFDSLYFKKTLVPLRDTALNKYMQLDAYLTVAYRIGPKIYERKHIDSARTVVVLPVFDIGYQFDVERSTHSYRDFDPDTNYYHQFYSRDSVYNDLNYTKVGNTFKLEYRPRKLTSDSTFEEKDFIAFAQTGFDYYLLKQNRQSNNFGDWYVSGTFRNNYSSKQKIIYNASAKYFLYGYNQNDLLVDGVVGYDFGKFGIVTGNASYQLKEAPYIYENYYNESDSAHYKFSYHYKLPKEKTLDIGGKYNNPVYGITADLNYYVVDHIPVYPGLSNPYVTNGVENVFVAHFGNKNGIQGFHLDNDIWFTAAPNGGDIKATYPMLYTKHSIFYEVRLFHKMLWLDVGFDLRIRYSNVAPYYDPLLGGFYPQADMGRLYPYLPAFSSRSYPILDFFVNAKVKTVRIYLKVSNISSEFGPQGYFSLYHYPAADITFQAGVKWRFFE